MKGAMPMRDQALTKRDEARLIKACQRVLLGGGFPTQSALDAPGIEILRAMAFRQLGIGQVDWIEHLGTCTPCFREYTEFRRKLEWRRRSAYVEMAAAVIVVILSVGRWR